MIQHCKKHNLADIGMWTDSDWTEIICEYNKVWLKGKYFVT